MVRGTRGIGVVVVCFLVGHGVALAQPPPPPPPPMGGGAAPGGEPAPTQWIGAGLVIVPAGTLVFEAQGMEQSESMAMAYGVEVVATRALGPNMDLLVAPRVLANIRGVDGTESATQLDLRAGLSFGSPIQPNLYLFGFGLAGYSMIFPPDNNGGESYTPAGLVVGFGGGAAFSLGPRLRAVGTLGYQLGFQGTTIMDIDVTLKDNLLDLTVGLMAGFD